jgi:ATP-dependent DNA helicase DinG
VREASRGEAIARLAETPHILLNAPLIGQRLGYPDVSGLDVLELFAFIHPARFVVPTVAGLARVVGTNPPSGDAQAAAALASIAEAILSRVTQEDWAEREGAWTVNATLYRLGWGWAPFVGQRLAKPEQGERMLFSRLPQWEDQAERPPPRTVSIPVADAQARLAELTGKGAEPRDGQRAMSGEAAAIFSPRRAAGEPNMLLAEAGTGIGKTLAYLAPASLWAERSGFRPSPKPFSGNLMLKAAASSRTRMSATGAS